EFVPELERAIPGYRQRLEVKPGVTGLAQVNLPPDTDLGSVRRKLAQDLYYVRHAGPWLDLALLAGTALHLVGVPFRWAGRLFGVPPTPGIEDEMRDALPPETIIAPARRMSA
ncbi:MAG: sugar transferase, partial [Gemmataceae bacterium]|nr:sugar transferase [Gemmataceae bacterium]